MRTISIFFLLLPFSFLYAQKDTTMVLVDESSVIIIYDDNTFLYTFIGGLRWFHTSGTLKQNDNKVFIFNSDTLPDSTYEVDELNDYTFTFSLKENSKCMDIMLPLVVDELYINQKKVCTNCEHYLYCSNEPVKNVRFCAMNYCFPIYFIKNQNTKTLLFKSSELKSYDSYKRYFQNEKWTIKRKKGYSMNSIQGRKLNLKILYKK